MPRYLENVQNRFEAWRSALADTLNHADAHLKAWLAIEGFREDHVEELNIAPAFWGLTMRAHLHEGLLNLALLVDKHPRSVSLIRLLDYVEKHLELFSDSAYESRLRISSSFEEERLKEMVWERKRVTEEKISEDKTVIARFEQDIENLRGWRDKALTHIDEDLLRKGESVNQTYPLLRSRTTEMLENFGNIFNFYSVAYDSRFYELGFPFKPGLQTMIKALAEWHEARRQARRERHASAGQ